MAPLVTYSGTDTAAELTGTLFSGKKFFLAQRLPSRSRYVADVQANGGTVVKLEKQADWIIADHFRTDAPPGSLSYTFIERAIKDGQFPPEEEHMAGKPKGTSRPVGSSAPTRNVRVPYTAEDDRILYDWVKSAEARGVAIKGQEVYKQLEAINSRHPWQSWRDRYLKQLALKPPPVSTASSKPPTAAATTASGRRDAQVDAKSSSVRQQATARRTGNGYKPKYSKVADPGDDVVQRNSTAESTPAVGRPQPIHTQAIQHTQTKSSHVVHEQSSELLNEVPVFNQVKVVDVAIDTRQNESEVLLEEPIRPNFVGFNDEDFENWLASAEVIQEVPVGDYHRAWMRLAEAYPEHTAEEWRAYYETIVLPVHLEREENKQDNSGDVPHKTGHFRNILKIFGTQGQPVYTPSKSSINGGTPRLSTTSNHPHDTKPTKTPHTNTKSALGNRLETPGSFTNSPLDGRGTLNQSRGPISIRTNVATTNEKPSKRKLVTPDDRYESTAKQRRVELLHSGPSQELQSRLQPPVTATKHISISSDTTSDDFENESEVASTSHETGLDDDAISRSSDTDALVQSQLLREMQKMERATLTARNLARAEAENNPRADKRALDIALDDETKDQSIFAGYLEGLLQGAASGEQISRADLDELKRRQQQLQELAHDGEDDEDEYDRDMERGTIDPENSVNVIRTQDVDPGLDDSSSSPSLPPSPEPDVSLHRSSQNGTTKGRDNNRSHGHPSIDEGDDLVPRYKGKGKAPAWETQDVFNSATQRPDLDIPEPESQFKSQHHGNETALDSQAMDEAGIEAFVEEQTNRGHPFKDVMKALFMTSMRRELCETVLEAMARGHATPKNVPGVWTEEEDKWLEGGDAGKLRKLNETHGWAECEARLEFLEEYRSVQ